MAEPTPASVESPAQPDLSGRKLGDFRLLRRLGRGAMAEVYLAEQESLKRQVAIKVLKSQLAQDAVYVQRFHHEAQAAASLVHANIVQIHDVGCVDGIHYIAQEYVAGQNLNELLSRFGVPDVPRAVSIMRQVAAALQKAADHGIVHRDIKPENIMLARTGEVKVADFGLARLTNAAGAVGLTQVGVTMGTPLYMSPEQVEGRALDARSDLYSFGVTCYHMLAGRPPFTGDTTLGVAVQHLTAQPGRLDELRPDLPPALCRCVHKLLSKDPAQRYASPRELLADLRGLSIDGDEPAAEHLMEDARAATVGSELTQRLQSAMHTSAMAIVRRKRARRGLLLVVAGGFLVGGAVAWATREPFQLDRGQPAGVPRQASAEGQLLMAKWYKTEEWFRSVEDYFPNDSYHVDLARRELVRLYLVNAQWDEALGVLAQLTQSDEAVFRAYGLAGQCFVHAMQSDYSEAVEALAKLEPMRENLDDFQMQELVRIAVNTTERAMSDDTSEEWNAWLASLPKDEPAEETP
jgi:serine/threonine-protein kinase